MFDRCWAVRTGAIDPGYDEGRSRDEPTTPYLQGRRRFIYRWSDVSDWLDLDTM